MEKKEKKAFRLFADEWKGKDDEWKLRGIGKVSPEKQQKYLDELSAIFETRNSYKSDIDFEDKFLDLWLHVYKHSHLEEIREGKQYWESMSIPPNLSSPITISRRTALRNLDFQAFYHLNFCKKLARKKVQHISKLRKRKEGGFGLQQYEAPTGSSNEDQELRDDQTWVIIPSTTNVPDNEFA